MMKAAPAPVCTDRRSSDRMHELRPVAGVTHAMQNVTRASASPIPQRSARTPSGPRGFGYVDPLRALAERAARAASRERRG